MNQSSEISQSNLPVEIPKSRKSGSAITEVMDAVPLLDTSRFEHMQRVASVMAASTLVPDALRFTGTKDNKELLPAPQILSNCFMVVNQAVRWGLDPFAVAQGVSVVHGKLCYEGKLVSAVLQAKMGISLKHHFTGDRSKDDFRIYLSDLKFTDAMIERLKPGVGFQYARVFDGSVGEWKTTNTGTPWTVKNFTRMLVYRGTRDWCRIYEPALMLGVYTPDEMVSLDDNARYRGARDVTPKTALAKQIENRAAQPQPEGPQEPQEGFNADLIEQQTRDIQTAPQDEPAPLVVQSEQQKSPPSQGDGEAEPDSVAPDVEPGSAEPEQLYPYEIAKELIACLTPLKTTKAVSNTWKVQFENRVAKLDEQDRSDLTVIAKAYSDHLDGKLEQIALDNFCEDTLGAMSERIVQPADEKLL